MASLNTDVVLDKPLRHVTVTVRLRPSREYRLRLWLTKRLFQLAVWVAGGDLDLRVGDE